MTGTKNYTIQYATVDGGNIQREYRTDLYAESNQDAIEKFKAQKNSLKLGFTPYVILDCFANNF